MGTKAMKLICEKTINGVTAVRSFTTPAIGDQGVFVRSIAGPGNPFWMWASVPPGVIIGADFTEAPICTDSPATNRQLIAAITATPEEVLVYQTDEEPAP